MIQFTNKTTALLYEALTEFDHYMIIPPTEGCGCKGYKGLLSNIDEHAAERLVIRKTNLIREKPATEVVTRDFDSLLNKKKEDEETEANPDSDTSVV
jgi:hypothetical protein